MTQKKNNLGLRCAVGIATGGGLGYFPVFPGTVGSLLGLVLFFPLRHLSLPIYLVFLVVLFGVGVFCSGLSESFFKKKDSGHIIIDEIHSMFLISFFIPQTPMWWIAGFVVFRFFDIKKPYPIRRFERLPGGWGVMMDDLIAALYGLALLHLIRLGLDLGGWAIV